jgi:hypothetical protein
MLLVEVADMGVGIPEEKRGLLFKPFSPMQRRSGGTGLGLYSLALRVQELGGLFGVRSRGGPSEGSIFFFAIPFNEAAEFQRAPVAVHAKQNRPSAPGGCTSKYKSWISSTPPSNDGVTYKIHLW